MTLETTPSDATLLCTSCGLCCTGALHDNAALDTDEVALAKGLGLPVIDACPAVFALPCPKLDGRTCSIFADRPRVCGRYECKLLQEVKTGEEPLSDALKKVAVARDLLDKVLADAGPGVDLPAARRAVIDLCSADDTAVSPNSANLVLHSVALTLYLDRHFRNLREGRYLVMDERRADGDADLD